MPCPKPEATASRSSTSRMKKTREELGIPKAWPKKGAHSQAAGSVIRLTFSGRRVESRRRSAFLLRSHVKSPRFPKSPVHSGFSPKHRGYKAPENRLMAQLPPAGSLSGDARYVLAPRLLPPPSCLPLSACSGCLFMQDKTLGESLDEASAGHDDQDAVLMGHGLQTGSARSMSKSPTVSSSSPAACPSEADRAEAERLAWTVKSVDEVANELIVGEARHRPRRQRSPVITQQVRTRLLADEAIKGVNYNVQVNSGVVYLLGIAQTEDELRRAAEHASKVKGVQKVVSYVKMRDRAGPPAPIQQAQGAPREETLAGAPARPLLASQIPGARADRAAGSRRRQRAASTPIPTPPAPRRLRERARTISASRARRSRPRIDLPPIDRHAPAALGWRMAIVPTVRCKSLMDAVAFYTQVLDFDRPRPADLSDPGFCILYREGEELHLSSHSGDGQFGQAIAVLVPDVDALFAEFLKRGLDASAKPQSEVHQGPTSQSWGTREFYVDDPFRQHAPLHRAPQPPLGDRSPSPKPITVKPRPHEPCNCAQPPARHVGVTEPGSPHVASHRRPDGSAGERQSGRRHHLHDDRGGPVARPPRLRLRRRRHVLRLRESRRPRPPGEGSPRRRRPTPPSKRPSCSTSRKDADVVLMRQDPPYHMGYLTAAHLLELIQPDTLVVNDPRGVLSSPEKVLPLLFPDLQPPTLITRDVRVVRDFRDSTATSCSSRSTAMAGQGCSSSAGTMAISKPSSASSCRCGPEPFIAQAFLPAVTEGDKRILLVDGELVGGINRRPPVGAIRSNLVVGGKAEATELSAREKEICAAHRP